MDFVNISTDCALCGTEGLGDGGNHGKKQEVASCRIDSRNLTNERMCSKYGCRYRHRDPCSLERDAHPTTAGENQAMPKELTDRQQEIFDFIAAVIHSPGAPPTIREIMDRFDINSTNGVRTTLAALDRKWTIRRHPRLSRGIELIDPAPSPVYLDTLEIPVLGRVAAGAPILAEEHVESTVHVDRSLIPSSGTVFALRVQGRHPPVCGTGKRRPTPSCWRNSGRRPCDLGSPA